jgi:hypothetical protein
MTGPEAQRSRRRRIAPAAITVVTAILVGALAAWLFVRPASSSAWVIPWSFYGTVGPSSFDATTAMTTTTVSVLVPTPACQPRGTSWLDTPDVSYASTSVTITLRTSEVFDALPGCQTTMNGKRAFGWVLDSYVRVKVPLREPLAGRHLFDGSSSPPAERVYGH